MARPLRPRMNHLQRFTSGAYGHGAAILEGGEVKALCGPPRAGREQVLVKDPSEVTCSHCRNHKAFTVYQAGWDARASHQE